MTFHWLSILALAGLGIFSGWLGALVGIGGGIVIIPALVLLFGIDIRLAVATSLVAVVATSTAAGSVYVGKGLSNMRLGMSLEIATTLGGISGGLLAIAISPPLISGLFAALMALTAFLMLRTRSDSGDERKNAKVAASDSKKAMGHEEKGKLAGSYYDDFQGKLVHYEATRLGLGAAISFVAGILSGMLGVGGGFVKVPAMNLGMRVPIKVAAATSNFMIGVTAVSSLFVYLARGMVHPLIACPVALGVVGGAFSGTRFSGRISPRLTRGILAVVLVWVAILMLLKALGVGIG